MKKLSKKISYIIYDLDGLLLNTEFFYQQVNEKIASRYGKILDESLKSAITGIQAIDVGRIVVSTLELPLTVEAYIQERAALLYELFPQALPLPGAVELTQHLRDRGIPQAIASSSVSRSFERKITYHRDWFALFNCIVLGDDPAIKQGKPAPDTFLIAAQRLGALPEQCLVFEDAPAGVEAARAAGMSVIAVRHPHLHKEAYQNADLVLNSLTEFEPEIWQLPPFERSPLSC